MYKIILMDFNDWFLAFAGFLNLCLGLVLILKPDLIGSLNRNLSQWISTRRLTRPLGVPRETTEYFMKYNTVLGWILLVGFAACMYIYNHNLNIGEFEKSMNQYEYGVVVEIVLISVKWIIITFMSIGIVLMLTLIFRPTAVKKIFQKTDRWVSTRKLSFIFDKLYFQFDEFVLKHNFIFGCILVIISGYMFHLFR
ncbi:MAG: hypothetical protein HQ510_05505 [Candidatus Marinimicrobia bacterium]|nr:hypothetical protein [Candidatus Neomarinimicrobiota bacterium]